MKRRINLVHVGSAAVIVAVAATLAVAGQATAAQPQPTPSIAVSHPNAITPAQMPGALQADEAAFAKPLPAGTTWPTRAPAFLTTPGTISDRHLPTITLAFYWQCAWERTLLNAKANGNPALQAQALDNLEHWTDIPIVKTNWSDPDDGYRTQVLNPAASGDVSGVQAAYDAGCSALTAAPSVSPVQQFAAGVLHPRAGRH